MPDLSTPRKYEHRPPHRPPHLPKRLTPPPERGDPPDLSLLLYVGLGLLVAVAVVAVPYVIGFLLEVVRP